MEADDAITRPIKVEFLRLRHAHFTALSDLFGAFDADLMGTDVSAQRISSGHDDAGEKFQCFSRYVCPGAAASDLLTQDVARKPESQENGFGFYFTPVCMG